MILEDKYLRNHKWVCMLAIALVILSLGDTVVYAADESQLSESVQVDEVDIMGAWNINWSMQPYEMAKGTNRLNMYKGKKVPFKLDWSPSPGTVRVGLYNHNTGSYKWLDNSNKPPFKGKLIVPANGLYSFAIHNDTNTRIYVTGYYKY